MCIYNIHRNNSVYRTAFFFRKEKLNFKSDFKKSHGESDVSDPAVGTKAVKN